MLGFNAVANIIANVNKNDNNNNNNVNSQDIGSDSGDGGMGGGDGYKLDGRRRSHASLTRSCGRTTRTMLSKVVR